MGARACSSLISIKLIWLWLFWPVRCHQCYLGEFRWKKCVYKPRVRYCRHYMLLVVKHMDYYIWQPLGKLSGQSDGEQGINRICVCIVCVCVLPCGQVLISWRKQNIPMRIGISKRLEFLACFKKEKNIVFTWNTKNVSGIVGSHLDVWMSIDVR